MSRIRSVLAFILGLFVTAVGAIQGLASDPPAADATFSPRPWIEIRGIYGGVPAQVFERGRTLKDYGINAVWLGSDSASREVVAALKARDPELKVFAEFNTMHQAGYLVDHPDASPVGSDGKVCPPPDGWQGVCATHAGYRGSRMAAFRKLLRESPIDGVWLDYHHAHASWEQAAPKLPDTCFCSRCLELFQKETSVVLPASPTPEQARRLLGVERESWVRWRSGVFTDWVREFRAILQEERPGALLGTFHCPWSDTDHDGALRDKLAIDLKSQARYLDVLSIMPYHARFGHAEDPEWVSRQVRWLSQFLGIKGEPGERLRIWPIVQLSDWGEPVATRQVPEVLEHGTRQPASGVMVFVWGTLHPQWEKVEAMGNFYRSIRP
jgi:hypothetical protein